MEDPAAPLVCLTNGGGIRADLPAGTVTFGDVTAVLPFGNTIEVLAIDGATLRAALEFAYDSVRLGPFADSSSPARVGLYQSPPLLPRAWSCVPACVRARRTHAAGMRVLARLHTRQRAAE